MIQLRILGAADLRPGTDEGAPIDAVLAQPKRFALLAFLAASAPRGLQRRDTLLALFWPEHDAPHARNSLSKALHHLRRSLGAGALATRGDEEVGVDDAALWCDVRAFERALDAGRAAEAVALYRGDLLAGFNVSGVAPEFDVWLEGERRRLRSRAAAAAWSLSRDAEGAGSGAEAVRLARWAEGLTPDDEAALRRLVALLDRLGDRAGALREYEAFASRMAAEYQVEPAAETRQLIEAVKERKTPRTVDFDDSPVAPLPTSASLAGPGPLRRSHWRRLLLGAASVAGLAALTAFALRSRARLVREAEPATIAVLPFVDLSPSHDNEYFSDGMTDELIDALGRVGGLHVTARSSAFAFKGSTADARTIGRTLGVSTLLEASVRWDGTRLRLTATLIDAVRGYNLWSQTYDREVADVFVVQDELTRSIVAELRSRFSSVLTAAATSRSTPSVAAYTHYLEGRYFWNRRTSAALKRAVGAFDLAVAEDSGYASAYAGLADAYSVLAAQGYSSPAPTFDSARTAAQRAIALDSLLPAAHAALGFVLLFHDWNGPGADRELGRALALDPSDARARLHRTFYYLAVGRPTDAVTEARQAVALDPLSLIINARLGFALNMARRFDEAIAAERHTLDLDSTFAPAFWTLGDALTLLHRFDEAIPAFRQAIAHSRLMLGDLGFAYGAAGNRAAAEHYLTELDARSRTAFVDPYERAVVYAGLGDADNAFRWLAAAYETRSPQMIWLRAEPMFDRLRGDSRFDALVQRVGL